MARRESGRRGVAGGGRLLPSGAEAIAIGTAAGSLVIGALQAHGAQTHPHDAGQNSLAVEMGWRGDAGSVHQPGAGDAAGVAVASANLAPPADPHAVPLEAVAPMHQGVSPELAPPAAAAEPAGSDAPNLPVDAAAGAVLPAVAAPNVLQQQLASGIADQIADSVSKILDGIHNGVPAADLGASIAQNIHVAVAGMVHDLDGGLAAQMGGLGAEIGATTGSLLDAGLGGLDGGGGSLLATLPAAVLGHDGADGSGGLLSQIFYDDGQSGAAPAGNPALHAMPDLAALSHSAIAMPEPLSDSAGSLVSDVASLHLGFMAQSYLDAGDGHYLPAPTAINALHLA